MREREPRAGDCQHQCDHARNQRKLRAEREQHHRDQGRQQHRDDDLEPVRPVGTADEILRQNLLDQLRMHRNAGHELSERRGAHFGKACSGGADQHDRSFDARPHLRLFCRIEHVLDGDVALRPVAIIVEPCLAVVGERHLEVADPHVEQRRVAAVGLAARAGAAHDDPLLTLRYAQRLAGKPRINPLAVGEQHRDAADDPGSVAR